jgi:hypothetical protein
VAACVVAAGLLVVARRRIFAASSEPTSADQAGSPAAAGGTASGGPAAGAGDRPAGAAERAAGGADAPAGPAAVPADLPDPPVEDVEVTDLLMVVDLKDEVLVIDEHPRYHLAGCAHLTGRATIPLPVDEARADGFTPCAVCEPDRNLAERARARKHARDT